MDVTISILTYKYGAKIAENLDAIFASKTKYSYEVIVVDNDSKDGIGSFIQSHYADKLQNGTLHFIQNNHNAGFSKGNNLAMKQAKGEYLLVLNPDTKIGEDTLEVMLDFMKNHHEVGIATCRLVKLDGSDDAATRRRIPNPWIALWRFIGLSKLFPNSKTFGAYNVTYKSPDESQEIECCVGAFMMVSPECLAKTKGFDEDYFMYGEDIDWCYRATQAGFKIWYLPTTKTIHIKGTASKQVSDKALRWFHQAMWIFYKKHFYDKYPKVFSFLVYLGIWFRFYVLRTMNALRKDPYVSK